MRVIQLLLPLLLTACSIFHEPKPVPSVDSVDVSVFLVEDEGLPPFVFGQSFWGEGKCAIVLKKSTYPDCMQHEMRHCFEGKWHGDKMSSEDCFSKDKK